LQFIILGLRLPLDVALLFDQEADKIDLKTDLAKLREEILVINDNPLFTDAIRKKLAQQEKSAYQTLSVPSNGFVIDPAKICYEKLIGAGSYGVVWKARIDSNYVAVKKMKSENLSMTEKAALRMEAEIMRQLSHPRIVACLGVFETPSEYCMVLEFW
jgi:hypothetical protein